MLEELTANSGKLISRTIRNCILHAVMHNGSFVIFDIVAASGYSAPTVAKYVSRMIEEQQIVLLDKVNIHTKGRSALRYGVNPNACYFLGVDMRAFELNIGLVNFIGEIVKIEHFSAFHLTNSYDVLDKICGRIQSFIRQLNDVDVTKIIAANINVPGRVNGQKGTSATTFNFEETRNTSLADILSDRIGIRTFIENDTKAMTFGEYVAGINRKVNNMLYINAGWGLGLGIVIDGKLYYGKDGYSGELGHVNHYDNNILCHCGKKGCIETEVSGRAILRKLIERMENGDASSLSHTLKGAGEITILDIMAAIRQEDPLCIEIISRTGAELGRHIAGLINLFNPELIVIGGNLSQAEPYYFLQPIEQATRAYSLKLMSENVPVVCSTLGVDAGVIGACLIARSKVFDSL